MSRSGAEKRRQQPTNPRSQTMKTSRGALQTSIKWQQIILASSKDAKQKQRARLAIVKLLEELQSLEEGKKA